MAKGTVKWFNSEKGLRLHRAGGRRPRRLRPLLQHRRQGYRELQEGQKVEFDVTQGQKGPQAENIRPV